MSRLRAALRDPEVVRLRRGLEFLLLNLIGRVPSHRLRRALYRRRGMRIAADAHVYSGAEVRAPRRIEIGSDSTIGFDAVLDGRGGIRIGQHVNFSSEVALWTMQHDPDDPDFATTSGPIVIEDYVWVSFRATILPNVTIGRGAVVSAGAVVTKDVPPMAVVGGIPAKVLRQRASEPRYTIGRPTAFV
jgi:acetyltransferase-like isoleucine patch superfamily enzyme